jgi:cell pole-organizing protein PopZ
MSDPTPSEPGMDEILASIRRIISDDQPVAETAKSSWPEGPLVLTQRVTPRPAPPAPIIAAPEVHAAEAAAPAIWASETLHTEPVHASEPPVEVHTSPAPDVLESRSPDAPVSDALPIVQPDPRIEETHTLDTAKQPTATPERAIVDDKAAAGAASSFDKLSDVVRGNVSAPPPIQLPPEGRTLEDLMRDMLQPMLKAWLDENLPAIVEARVDEEVERISRRRVR